MRTRNDDLKLNGFNVTPRQSLESIHTNPHEVKETLNSLSVGKAACVDGINNILLKPLSNNCSAS